MLVEERGCDQRHRRVIGHSKFRSETERNQRQEHEEVKPLRQPQTLRDPEFDDQRAQSFPAIEIDILRCVNQIETRHPADYSGTQNQRRQIEPAGLRNPGAGRRNGERDAEKKVGRAGEPLRQRVEENNEKRDRREEAGRAVDRRARNKKSNRAESPEAPRRSTSPGGDVGSRFVDFFGRATSHSTG